MVEHYNEAIRIPVPGGKIIDEHIGAASTGETSISVAHMVAPAGWDEPFQTPQFDEYTIVLKGTVIVDHDGGRLEVNAGESVKTVAGERIRYSCGHQGAEYIAVCLPAFSPDTVNRED